MTPITRFSDLQEAQKEIDQILHIETLKRKASEIKLQEQIDGFTTEVNTKFDHLSQILASIQLQLLNKDKGKEQMDDHLVQEGEAAALQQTKKSNHVIRKIEKRQAERKIDQHVDGQFGSGRLLACISSRPGQCGRSDGYISEGKELEFYMKKLQKKKGKAAGGA